MNEVAHRVGSTLAIRGDQADWTPEQGQALLEMFNLGGAPLAVIRSYFHVCQSTGLDPFKRQIHLIDRQGKFTPQTSIDGFRIIRDRSGVFDGGEIAWCGPDGQWVDVWLKTEPPAAARYTLHRTDQSIPVVATALWGAYVQTRGKDGAVTHMWARMGAHMLAKVAEALAIRMAFPDDTGGLYSDDEMGQADNGQQLEPGETHTSRRTTKRERSPGIMDLDVPPETLANVDPGIGGGFMQAPPAPAAPAADSNIVDAVIVEDPQTPPNAPVAPEPTPVPEQQQTATEQPAAGQPMNMQPEPTPEISHANLWSAKLATVLEAPDWDIYTLRVLYDEAAGAGALEEPIPWNGGRTFDETVNAIRMNVEAGRASLDGIA